MEENKFSLGKIYEVTDKDCNECYIGSTCEKFLGNRMSRHRWSYRRYLKKADNRFQSIFELFDKYGMDNCKIVLLEDFPCNSKKELEDREGYYIQNTTCLNYRVAGRKSKQYYRDNIEQIQQYHLNNKERKKEYMKNYRLLNRERLRQQTKDYHEKHKDQINARKREYWKENQPELTRKQREKYNLKKSNLV